MPRKLTSLSKNERSVITDIGELEISDKLYEYGVFAGSEILVVEKLPFDGPIYILSDGNRICLRIQEAEAIIVE